MNETRTSVAKLAELLHFSKSAVRVQFKKMGAQFSDNRKYVHVSLEMLVDYLQSTNKDVPRERLQELAADILKRSS